MQKKKKKIHLVTLLQILHIVPTHCDISWYIHHWCVRILNILTFVVIRKSVKYGTFNQVIFWMNMSCLWQKLSMTISYSKITHGISRKSIQILHDFLAHSIKINTLSSILMSQSRKSIKSHVELFIRPKSMSVLVLVQSVSARSLRRCPGKLYPAWVTLDIQVVEIGVLTAFILVFNYIFYISTGIMKLFKKVLKPFVTKPFSIK